MNERIKALAIEANFALYEDGNFRSDPGQWINQEISQFAELIIQECLAQVDEIGDMFKDGSEKLAVTLVEYAIKKHFSLGVEK